MVDPGASDWIELSEIEAHIRGLGFAGISYRRRPGGYCQAATLTEEGAALIAPTVLGFGSGRLEAARDLLGQLLARG